MHGSVICADVLAPVRAGRFPLVLTERTEHLRLIAEELAQAIPRIISLQGGMARKEIQAALALLAEPSESQGRVLLATGRYIGEGFDEPRLDTLFLTLPISWRGTIAQYVGRLHRLHEGKREVQVYDYADLDVPMLARMFDRRCAGYEAAGYTLLLPGSAVAGWPAEVPLPIAPEWKREYAASVRRLVCDGVDLPLASLFVDAARSPTADAEGASRPEARQKPSYIAPCKRWRQRRDDLSSTHNSQFHSKREAAWRWTCSVKLRVWSSNRMVGST